MPTAPHNSNAAPHPQRLIADYIRAANNINDKYKAPEIRKAAADYMAWLEDVIVRGIAAKTADE
ncbi:hypothetical protein [Micromonospora wenchangensis]|nr:hypothetical protein [Micromonospora wenchangensis]